MLVVELSVPMDFTWGSVVSGSGIQHLGTAEESESYRIMNHKEL